MYCVLIKSICVYNMISLSLDFIFIFYKIKFMIWICKVKDNDKYLFFFFWFCIFLYNLIVVIIFMFMVLNLDCYVICFIYFVEVVLVIFKGSWNFKSSLEFIFFLVIGCIVFKMYYWCFRDVFDDFVFLYN